MIYPLGSSPSIFFINFINVIIMKKFTLKTVAFAAAMLLGSVSANAQTMLTKEMYHEWSGPEADATIVKENPGNCEYNIGTGEASGQIYGHSTVPVNCYADVSEYDEIMIVGEPNKITRFCMNRQWGDAEKTPENAAEMMVDAKVTLDASGMGTLDLHNLVRGTIKDDFAHINAIKDGSWSSQKVTVIGLVKKDPTGITTITDFATGEVLESYNTAGVRVNPTTKGVVILKYKSGKTVKIVNK